MSLIFITPIAQISDDKLKSILNIKSPKYMLNGTLCQMWADLMPDVSPLESVAML